ncbi:putative vacuolar protein sorting-associated protein [Helianthus annuus]|nr:putative vacuolar protein sorting-associated protein [Helianthus annuus]
MHSLICMIFFTFLTISLLFNGAKMVESSNRTLLHLENVSQRRRELVGIETTFKFPSPLPNWPPGGGFAGGTIDLGGLLVSQVTTFNKIWSANEGGPGNAGATFYDAVSIPEGFSVLGCVIVNLTICLYLGIFLWAKMSQTTLQILLSSHQLTTHLF